jgi:hypothetical protein
MIHENSLSDSIIYNSRTNDGWRAKHGWKEQLRVFPDHRGKKYNGLRFDNMELRDIPRKSGAKSLKMRNVVTVDSVM